MARKGKKEKIEEVVEVQDTVEVQDEVVETVEEVVEVQEVVETKTEEKEEIKKEAEEKAEEVVSKVKVAAVAETGPLFAIEAAYFQDKKVKVDDEAHRSYSTFADQMSLEKKHEGKW